MIFAPMLGRTRKEPQQADSKDAESTVSLVGFRPVYVWDRLSRDLRPGLCAPDGVRQ
jgi:hypothetical protein